MKIPSLALSALLVLPIVFLHTSPTELEFSTPVDAISFTLQNDDDVRVRALQDGVWQPWQQLEIEKEFDPTLQESNVVLFDSAVQKIQVRSSNPSLQPNPIRLDGSAPSYEVAIVQRAQAPRILSRRQWGANDDFLVNGDSNNRSDELGTETDVSNKTARQIECEQWQQQYPQDFTTTGLTTRDAAGRELRWPQRYSPNVHTLVVHHTASANNTNTRSGYETMQALYAYHANNRGWGDIGYHYVIDNAGQIYEGKAGGRGVVGGHAYCNNVGTLGIALMGNFDEEAPSSAQTQSLQWLLDYLAKDYRINLAQNVQYHGISRSPILGHKDLISTACPGSILYDALSQIKSNVIAGNLRSSVYYNALRTPAARTVFRISGLNRTGHQLSFMGSSKIVARPSGFINVQLQLKVGSSGLTPRQTIADIDRSSSSIGVWQLNSAGKEVRALNSLISFGLHSPGETLILPIRLQVPEQAGSYTLRIGSAILRIDAEGRRSKVSSLPVTPLTSDDATVQRARSIRTISTTTAPTSSRQITFRPIVRRSLTQNRSSASAFTRTTSTYTTPATNATGPIIRVKLSHSAEIMAVTGGTSGLRINGADTRNTVQIRRDGTSCIVYQNNRTLAEGAVVRMVPNSESLTIESWDQTFNEFRGILECRVEDDQLILINELPLEEYMWGLSEEPDTEPYQKQRAFAIAARSYAAHYLDPRYRKFPGKSYDGSDSPAIFQKYSGKKYEVLHPRWIEAVKSTALQVVIYNGQVVKTPYFSSDDGRTRSPSERGWNSFLFAEIFTSKPDPWCEGQTLRGHGVGMSGCGAEGQANEGKTAEQILNYYYPGTSIERL